MQRFTLLLTIIVLAFLSSCKDKKETETTPWGEEIGEDGSPIENIDSATHKARFSMADIISAGELVVLTLNGPETYYDYHGHGMGLQYMLTEKYAETIGVSVRVDVCRDSVDMMKRLEDGEGDLIAYPVRTSKGREGDSLIACGMNDGKNHTWLVSSENKELAQSLDKWFKPNIISQTQAEIKNILASGMVVRHVYPFMLSRSDAVISRYDPLFRKYSQVAGVDWTFMASQCYQESCFDPNARSWAGACGLMQIMPATADHLGLPRSEMFSPEPNIAASARFMRELQQKFSDIGSRRDRICFALACYNGGYWHIRDAMALARKYGKNSQRWNDVKEYILGLQQSKYYNDPVVKHGYMRGTETVAYVDKIVERWDEYRHATHGKYSSASSAPVRAKHANRWTK